MMRIDLRSDTVTMPDERMLQAMFNADAGDMVLGEDPSVNELERMAAALFGMQDAAYCPSGTMTNQIAVNVHTRPGDEVICSRISHLYLHEGGGIAFNSGASVALIDTPDGTFTAGQVEANINPDDPHKAKTSLVCVENTVNRGGGKIWNYDELLRIGSVCRKYNLKYHLDGARLFNAIVETDKKPSDYGSIFDSVSICLSKGLGAPVGSLLIGTSEFIHHARRVRKAFGGTMRQAGYIAAAGIYALKYNIDRLRTDHAHAKRIASVLQDCKWVKEVFPCDTNIVILRTDDTVNAVRIAESLSERNILVNAFSRNHIRIVTHLNISAEMTEEACDAFLKLS